MEGFSGSQNGTDTVRKKRARKAEYSGGAEQQKYPMSEYYIGHFMIPFSHMDGTNRHAAHTDSVKLCTTPDDMAETLLEHLTNYLEYKATLGRRELTEDDLAQVEKQRQIMIKKLQ